MAEDSEVDSNPSNECKKVNDLSSLGRGAHTVVLSLKKAWYKSNISPVCCSVPSILWMAVADVGYKRGF